MSEKLPMFAVLQKFLMDSTKGISHSKAYFEIYHSVSRDDPHAVVEPGPSDKKRLDAAENRAAERIATQQVGSEGTKTMVTQMYKKADLMAELKEKVGQSPAPTEGSKGSRGLGQ